LVQAAIFWIGLQKHRKQPTEWRDGLQNGGKYFPTIPLTELVSKIYKEPPPINKQVIQLKMGKWPE
jgi:hypothetical protein